MAIKVGEVLKYVYLKKKNKRIFLQFCSASDGGHCILLHTRRLIDWRTRDILESNLVLGVESFEAISDIMNLLSADPEYRKHTHVERNSALKEKFSAMTNCKH